VQALPPADYAERSDPGRDPDKQINEDAWARRETRFGHLCVVCDGMGGHAGGREAAALAVLTILASFDRAADACPPAEVLRAAIEGANRAVHEMRTSEVGFGRPGSTVAAILMHAHGTEVAHVGDSRVYLIRQGQVSRVTRDHSLVQELVDRGLLSPEQATSHPDANRITRALGMTPEVEIDVRPNPVMQGAGDAFVLCSDGLSDLVEDQEIGSITASDPPEKAVVKLVDLANARGGHDNITVMVLRAKESALATTAALAPVARATAIEQGPRSGRVSVGIAVAVVLSCIGVVLLGALLTLQFAQRAGKRDARGEALFRTAFDAGATAPTALATERLAPENVVFPSTSVSPAERIAPLEPAATASKKRRR
jgi:serine/threonine protein phosphatase PrpC